ncbi:MAG: formylglycine-generating enzyme family protein [Desulfuromonadaceae bacterium]|nr:formylglycine-generating enzyme family protein [Desulfuromonadaceae bacterium]MDD2856989.1 formylglycine-generating enzyme family protein [Desulfuromonadaceae bacterium]
MLNIISISIICLLVFFSISNQHIFIAEALAANKNSDTSSTMPIVNSKNMQTGMEFVFVPGGCFTMGSEKGNLNEKPVHQVCLSDFFIGKYEVTQGDWQRVMGYNPSKFKSCGDSCPVEQVGWNEAQEFIRKLNNMTGKTYYLPTEAEWEYACRSGGKSELYCGGENITDLAWQDRNVSGGTHPVGLKAPNGIGAYDMSGNVWEWVEDWSGDYLDIDQQDPAGPSSGSSRVRRGGSWHYGANQARSTWRSSGYPDDQAFDLGFRIMYPGP